MTDNPLVEAVAKHISQWLEQETGVLMKPRTSKRCATAALRAIEDAGWKVVPVEATPDMENAAYEVQVKGADLHDFTAHDCAKDIWAAMISAAPKS